MLDESRFITSDANLDTLADASPYIFIGSIKRTRASNFSTLPVDSATVVVQVEEMVRTPLGHTAIPSEELTVQLKGPLGDGRYVFFADPWASGDNIAVRERAHLAAEDPNVREQIMAAMERGYAMRIAPRLQAAKLVTLATVGEPRLLPDAGERKKTVDWVVAPLELEEVIKADPPIVAAFLLGPRFGSKRLPRAPAVQPGRRAVLFLQSPPVEALEAFPDVPPDQAVFIADTSDIQPPDRLVVIAQLVGELQKEQ
jgi:hypothetical protein